MGAKQKLNNVHVMGSLVVAGIIGGLTGSWAVFAAVAIVLLAAAYESGDIRA